MGVFVDRYPIFVFDVRLRLIQGINKQMKDFSSLMKERITELQITGLPEDWAGVYEATSK